MRRGLLVVAAWVLATGGSILVAYAAVGEVRDRVVDQPQALSVALASTTVPDTVIVPPTTSTPGGGSIDTAIGPETTTTSSPESSQSTTATSTTTTPATASNAGTTTTIVQSQDGRIETYSTPGGSVSIEVFPDRLRLLGAVPATGFAVSEQEIAPTQIEIEFRSDEDEVHFKASLESNGEVDIDVETDD
jgi:hypothetical protein